jgi:acetyl esterase/lipase
MTRRSLLAALMSLPALPAAASTELYADPGRRGIAPRVDLDLPAGAQGAVILVHGGGFVVGSRRMTAVRRCAEAVVERGLAAVAVDYRLLGRGGRFADALDDLHAAADWWRGVAVEHGVHPDRLGWWGISAGAALTAVASSRTGGCAWVGAYGPYDFRRLPGRQLGNLPARWLVGSAQPSALALESPLHRCTTPAPTLLLHGSRDRLVPLAHAERLRDVRLASGLPVQLEQVSAGHGFLRRQTATADHALRLAADFLEAHI